MKTAIILNISYCKTAQTKPLQEQQHGRPQIGHYAKTGTVGDAEARHEGATGSGGADRQGHEPGATARARRDGDGQGPVAEPQQQGSERAAVVAHKPRHCGHAEERSWWRRRRFVGQGFIRLRGQYYG